MSTTNREDFPELLARTQPTTVRHSVIEYLIRNPAASYADAARSVGTSKSTVSAAISKLRKARAKQDPSAHTLGAPEDYHLGGVTTGRQIILPDGTKAFQWVKTTKTASKTKERITVEQIVASANDAADRMKLAPLPRVPEPEHDLDADLCAIYPWGDPHIGMAATRAQTGEDFDLGIAKRNILEAQTMLVARAPAATHAIVAPMGDNTHADNKTAKTPRSGAPLDVVGQPFHVVFDVMLDTVVEGIAVTLAKHQTVDVIPVMGNHDPATSIALKTMLRRLFADNPRVKVYSDPKWIDYVQWGINLLGFTHGHNVKAADHGRNMADDVPGLWGVTEFRQVYAGHVHHELMKIEERGTTTEYVNTLAPLDDWHTGQGYRSRRGAFVDIWDRNKGFRSKISASIRRSDLGGDGRPQ